jgi:hypothetical protein
MSAMSRAGPSPGARADPAIRGAPWRPGHRGAPWSHRGARAGPYRGARGHPWRPDVTAAARGALTRALVILCALLGSLAGPWSHRGALVIPWAPVVIVARPGHAGACRAGACRTAVRSVVDRVGPGRIGSSGPAWNGTGGPDGTGRADCCGVNGPDFTYGCGRNCCGRNQRFPMDLVDIAGKSASGPYRCRRQGPFWYIAPGVRGLFAKPISLRASGGLAADGRDGDTIEHLPDNDEEYVG